MSDSAKETLREKNKIFVEHFLATALTEGWYDNIAEDAALEFPYGPSLGVPDRFEGHNNIETYLRAMVAQVGLLKFRDIVVTGTTDPSVFFNEYTATAKTPRGTTYDQVYISKVVVRDGKVVLYREFWDPARVIKAVDNFSAG